MPAPIKKSMERFMAANGNEMFCFLLLNNMVETRKIIIIAFRPEKIDNK